MNESLPMKISVPKLPEVLGIESGWVTIKSDILERVNAITEVSSQSSFNEAEIVLKMITSHSNALEKQRKELAKPFQAIDKQIKALADSAREDLEIAKSNLKNKMTAYVDAQNQKRQEELEQKSEITKENPFAQYTQPSVLQPETAPVTKLATSTVYVWKFEIIDATQIPREFCIPDESKIRKYVQDNKEGAAIPGVRTWQETQIKSR